MSWGQIHGWFPALTVVHHRERAGISTEAMPCPSLIVSFMSLAVPTVVTSRVWGRLRAPQGAHQGPFIPLALTEAQCDSDRGCWQAPLQRGRLRAETPAHEQMGRCGPAVCVSVFVPQ